MDSCRLNYGESQSSQTPSYRQHHSQHQGKQPRSSSRPFYPSTGPKARSANRHASQGYPSNPIPNSDGRRSSTRPPATPVERQYAALGHQESLIPTIEASSGSTPCDQILNSGSFNLPTGPRNNNREMFAHSRTFPSIIDTPSQRGNPVRRDPPTTPPHPYHASNPQKRAASQGTRSGWNCNKKTKWSKQQRPGKLTTAPYDNSDGNLPCSGRASTVIGIPSQRDSLARYPPLQPPQLPIIRLPERLEEWDKSFEQANGHIRHDPMMEERANLWIYDRTFKEAELSLIEMIWGAQESISPDQLRFESWQRLASSLDQKSSLYDNYVTRIGVCGTSGHGKSQLVAALLGDMGAVIVVNTLIMSDASIR